MAEMKKHTIPRGCDSAALKLVIETKTLRGEGTRGDPARIVKQYWDFDGNLLAEMDPTDEREKLNSASH